MADSAKSASSRHAGVQVEDGEQRQGHQRRRVRVKSAADVHFPQLAREVEIGTLWSTAAAVNGFGQKRHVKTGGGAGGGR